MMTKMKLRKLVVLLLFFASTYSVNAQCGAEPITVTDWCENGFAKWEFDSPTSGASYVWYDYFDPDTLTPASLNGSGLLRFEAKLDSTDLPEFYSPIRVSAPLTSVEYVYFKILNGLAVPFGAPTFTQVPINTPFEMDFSITNPIRFNSIKVPVVLMNPNRLYKIQVEFQNAGIGSAVYTFSGLSATQISGNNYLVTIPIDLTLTTPGLETISINTNPTGGGTASQVNGLLVSNTQITPQTVFPVSIAAGSANASGGGFTVGYDWDFTTVCEPQLSGISS